jgi:hypothetical protein
MGLSKLSVNRRFARVRRILQQQLADYAPRVSLDTAVPWPEKAVA